MIMFEHADGRIGVRNYPSCGILNKLGKVGG